MAPSFDIEALRAHMRAWLSEPGNSMAKLARMSGVKRPTCHSILHGPTNQPAAKTVAPLAKVVGYTFDTHSPAIHNLEAVAGDGDELFTVMLRREDVLAAQLMVQLLREMRDLQRETLAEIRASRLEPKPGRDKEREQDRDEGSSRDAGTRHATPRRKVRGRKSDT